MIQTQGNSEKLHFGHDLGLLGQNSGRESFFPKIWLGHSQDIMVGYHHVQY